LPFTLCSRYADSDFSSPDAEHDPAVIHAPWCILFSFTLHPVFPLRFPLLDLLQGLLFTLTTRSFLFFAKGFQVLVSSAVLFGSSGCVVCNGTISPSFFFFLPAALHRLLFLPSFGLCHGHRSLRSLLAVNHRFVFFADLFRSSSFSRYFLTLFSSFLDRGPRNTLFEVAVPSLRYPLTWAANL